MKTVRFLFGTLAVAGLFVMNSCQKDNESPTLSEQIAEEDAASDEISNVVDDQVDYFVSADLEDDYYPNTAPSALKSASTEVTYPQYLVTFPEQTRWPVEITIDYGPENIDVVLWKGRLDSVVVKMRGQIKIEKTGPHFAEGSTTTVTFDGYYVNDVHIEGNEVYSNDGLNESNHPEFTWTVALTLTTPKGLVITRTVNKVREMVAGSSTPKYIWDDEFLVNGTVTGGNSNGWSYTHTITDLLRKRVCRFPVSGTLSVENTKTSFTVDYGNGECDPYATVTDADGNISTIVLGRKWIRK